MGNRSHRDRELRGIRDHISEECNRAYFTMDYASRSPLVPRSIDLRSSALDARGARGTSKILLFPFRRRTAPVHRRILRLDGRRTAAGEHRAELEVFFGARNPRRAAAPHHVAAQVRYEASRRAAQALKRQQPALAYFLRIPCSAIPVVSGIEIWAFLATLGRFSDRRHALYRTPVAQTLRHQSGVKPAKAMIHYWRT